MHSQVGEDGPDTYGTVTVLDRQSRQSFGAPIKSFWSHLVVPSEAELALSNGVGLWERRSLSDLTRIAGGRVSVGAHDLLSAISPSGRFISHNNGSIGILLWRTGKPTTIYSDPDLRGRAPGGGFAEALALSSDGKRTAIADTGTIYISDTSTAGTPQTTRIALTGNSNVNENGLSFLADNDHLLSASGNSVAVWDLTQLSPISQQIKMPVGYSCNACQGPKVAVRPDGKAVAIGHAGGLELFVRELDNSGRQTVIESNTWSKRYGPPMWSLDGKNLLLSTHGDEDQSVEIRSAVPGTPPLGHWQSGPGAGSIIEAFVLSSDGRRAVTIGSNGVTVIRDASTGAIKRVVQPPVDIKELAQSYQTAAVNADATTVAIIGGPISGVEGTVKVVNLETGGSRTLGEGAANGVAFSGEYLLVQRTSGVLEVWDATGTHLQRSIPGEPNYEVGPAANPQGTLVARKRSDGTVRITDLRSGESLGTFRLPGPAKVGMAFAPNGHTLLTVTADLPAARGTGQLQQWNLSESAWVQIACRSVGRNLTAMEWQRYVGGAPPTNLGCG
jgi:WD40 repeat protein